MPWLVSLSSTCHSHKYVRKKITLVLIFDHLEKCLDLEIDDK